MGKDIKIFIIFLKLILFCREEGIRTLDTLVEYTHFPGVRLRPLGHLSIVAILDFKGAK
jgi:hypothetical protein